MGVIFGSRDIEKSDIKPILLTFCKGKQAMGALPRAANGVFVVIQPAPDDACTYLAELGSMSLSSYSFHHRVP